MPGFCDAARGCSFTLVADGTVCNDGNPAPTADFCAAGVCVGGCAAGGALCGGACVNTEVDRNHCGGCGRTCGAHQACVAGSCNSTSAVALGESHSCALVDGAYHQHLRSLSNLLGHDPDALDRLDAKAAADHSAEEKIEALNRLVDEITRARESVPVSLLDDAGLSADVLDALTSSARDARDARTSLRHEMASRQLLPGELVPHVGRMVFELRQLLGSVKESRRTDPTLPTFRSKFVHRRAKVTRTPASPPAPVEPPAPPK